MYLYGIWIKSIALIITGVIVLLSGIYAYKKLNWKQYEFIFVIIVCAFLLVFGCKNINYAINPEIETINVNYLYQSSNGVIFGREYFFIDENGNNYELTMDPITSRKIFNNKEFSKSINYTIKYEKKSKTIVNIR